MHHGAVGEEDSFPVPPPGTVDGLSEFVTVVKEFPHGYSHQSEIELDEEEDQR